MLYRQISHHPWSVNPFLLRGAFYTALDLHTQTQGDRAEIFPWVLFCILVTTPHWWLPVCAVLSIVLCESSAFGQFKKHWVVFCFVFAPTLFPHWLSVVAYFHVGDRFAVGRIHFFRIHLPTRLLERWIRTVRNDLFSPVFPLVSSRLSSPERLWVKTLAFEFRFWLFAALMMVMRKTWVCEKGWHLVPIATVMTSRCVNDNFPIRFMVSYFIIDKDT